MARTTRTNESRAADARPEIGGPIERLRLDIDVSKLPREMEATWVREVVAGQPDDENVQRAMEERRMRPATYDELNLPKPPVLPGRAVETHGLIRRGGSILMVRERAVAQKERAAVAKANEDILKDAHAANAFKQAARATGAETPASENQVRSSETKADGRFQE